MEKNDLITRIDEFRNLVSNREYEKATEVADELDLKKIKDNNFLSLVADVYELMRMYDKSKKVLLILEKISPGQVAFHRTLVPLPLV